MSIMTGISITLGCILLAALFMVHAEEREEAYRAEREAKERRYLLFKMAQADMQLRKDAADEAFDRAVWFGRVDDLR